VGKRAVKYWFILSSLPTKIPPDKSWVTKKSSKYLKFNTPVDDRSAIFWDGRLIGHFLGWTTARPFLEWTTARPFFGVDDRSAIFGDGQEYGHFFWVDDCSAIFWVDDCSAIFLGGRLLGHFFGWTTGVLNFRDFEGFFFIPDW